MTTTYILHGCPSDIEKAMDPETRTYDKHWIPWIKERLEAGGMNVVVPLMPNPWAPDYAAYKQAFDQLPVSDGDILIGHSCGGAFLVRWLGDTKRAVSKLILVAPWKIPDSDDPLRIDFYGYDIDRSIPERVGKIVLFTSNDEEEDGKESVRLFHASLGGQVIELPNHGHYTQGDMGTVEFPELLEAIR